MGLHLLSPTLGWKRQTGPGGYRAAELLWDCRAMPPCNERAGDPPGISPAAPLSGITRAWGCQPSGHPSVLAAGAVRGAGGRGWAPSYPLHVLCSRLSARQRGCSLVAGLALQHRARPVLALHCLQLRLEALQAPVLPILGRLQVVAHGAVGLVCRGGRRRQAQLRLLQDRGHEELPRGTAGVRDQGLGPRERIPRAGSELGAASGWGGYSRWSWGWRRRCSARRR